MPSQMLQLAFRSIKCSRSEIYATDSVSFDCTEVLEMQTLLKVIEDNAVSHG